MDGEIPRLYFEQLLSYKSKGKRNPSSLSSSPSSPSPSATSSANGDASGSGGESRRKSIAVRALEVSIVLSRSSGDEDGDAKAFGKRFMRILKYLKEDIRPTPRSSGEGNGSGDVKQDLAEMVLFFIQSRMYLSIFFSAR